MRIWLLSQALTVHYASAFTLPNSSSATARFSASSKAEPRSKPFSQQISGTRTRLSMSQSDPFGAIFDIFQKNKSFGPNTSSSGSKAQEVVELFIAGLNSRSDPADLMYLFQEDINFVDTSYYNPIQGKEDLLKHFYLHSGSSPLSTYPRESLDIIVVDDIVATSTSSESTSCGKVCVMYHMETQGEEIADSTGITFYNLEDDKISQVFDVTEPSSPKPGDSGLRLLKTVSKFIGDESIVMKGGDVSESRSIVEKYFDAWNRRDMKDAVSLFDKDCAMRDLQYDDAFSGRAEFERHLLRVEDCLPRSFEFVVDDIATTPQKAGVLWHVENNGSTLAFTRGCSFYTLDEKSGLIKSGFEIPEKAPPKEGYINTLTSRFAAEPIRLLPAAIWAAYMYILFFSEGILPGVNALALEQRTWEEVRDLSLNFFLVSPILDLPFAPVVHPMLEGVFNLLLAWAAMFAGFLSDERKNKPNLLPFGPMLVGMQFLTSGFLLPYLFCRTPETEVAAFKEDIDGDLQATVAEWKPLGGFLGTVGTASIIWGLYARPEFGTFGERYNSFIDLLSIDRVGSSFLVDLAIFAVFQGWFVDDDLQRRRVRDEELTVLRNVAKYIPFFGLAAYLTFRPPLPSREK